MWRDVKPVLERIERLLPINSAYLFGSFTSDKRRPADMDFMVLLKVAERIKARWSFDLVMAPDNQHGKFVLEDIEKWMKQKYGGKRFATVKLK